MKILLFIALKIIEVGGLIFIPYWIGKFMEKYVLPAVLKDNKFTTYLHGLASLIIVPFVILIVSLIVEFCKMNWNIVNQIIR